MPRFPLNLSEDDHRDLDIAAKVSDMTMTAFIREAIREKIDRQLAGKPTIQEAFTMLQQAENTVRSLVSQGWRGGDC
jgi:predicted transcriptional regulator